MRLTRSARGSGRTRSAQRPTTPTPQVKQPISELGEDEFYQLARARREQRRPDPITARLLWGLLLAFSVGAAGVLGNVVDSVFMAADVFLTILCIALTVATIRNDW